MHPDVTASLLNPGFDAFDELDELLALLRPPAWHTDAACRGVGAATFFPERDASAAAARTICATCPVRADCLAAAHSYGTDTAGVWGGTTARERARLRRPARPPSPRPATPRPLPAAAEAPDAGDYWTRRIAAMHAQLIAARAGLPAGRPQHRGRRNRQGT